MSELRGSPGPSNSVPSPCFILKLPFISLVFDVLMLHMTFYTITTGPTSPYETGFWDAQAPVFARCVRVHRECASRRLLEDNACKSIEILASSFSQ